MSRKKPHPNFRVASLSGEGGRYGKDKKPRIRVGHILQITKNKSFIYYIIIKNPHELCSKADIILSC